MSSQQFSVSFTIVQYNVGGSQAITAVVQPGWTISGSLQYFPQVSGGTATVSIQYWKDGKAVLDPVTFTITAQLPNQDSITMPDGVDRMVVTVGEVTLPAGSVTIALSS